MGRKRNPFVEVLAVTDYMQVGDYVSASDYVQAAVKRATKRTVAQVKANTGKLVCPTCQTEFSPHGRTDDAVTVRRPGGTRLVFDIADRPAFEWLVRNRLKEILDSAEASVDDRVLSRDRNGVEAPDPRKAKNTFEFVELMNALVDWANPPSHRQLVSRVPELRRSTLSEALNTYDRLPKQEFLQALVKACKAEADWPKWLETLEKLKAEQKARQSAAQYTAPIPQNLMRTVALDTIK